MLAREGKGFEHHPVCAKALFPSKCSKEVGAVWQ